MHCISPDKMLEDVLDECEVDGREAGEEFLQLQQTTAPVRQSGNVLVGCERGGWEHSLVRSLVTQNTTHVHILKFT